MGPAQSPDEYAWHRLHTIHHSQKTNRNTLSNFDETVRVAHATPCPDDGEMATVEPIGEAAQGGPSEAWGETKATPADGKTEGTAGSSSSSAAASATNPASAGSLFSDAVSSPPLFGGTDVVGSLPSSGGSTRKAKGVSLLRKMSSARMTSSFAKTIGLQGMQFRQNAESTERTGTVSALKSWLRGRKASTRNITAKDLDEIGVKTGNTAGATTSSNLTQVDESGQMSPRTAKRKKISNGAGTRDARELEMSRVAKQVPALICVPLSGVRSLWNMVIALLVLWNLIILPIDCAFDVRKGGGWLLFDAVCDLVFIVDVFIQFATPYLFYVEGKRQWETSKRKIMCHYLASWFVVDLLAAIPFDVIFGAIAAVGPPEASGTARVCDRGSCVVG